MAARCWGLIVAAGSGRRMGGEVPKQYLELAGRSVLEHSLSALLTPAAVGAAALVLSADDERWPALGWRGDKPIYLATGGAERQDSVLAGLGALAARAAADDWVLVHDAARPCLHPGDLQTLIDTLYDDPVGGLLAVRARDTIKRADGAGLVIDTPPRETLWHAQTPQMFRYALLVDALRDAALNDAAVTDEASALERRGLAPRLVEGRADNIKVTAPEDLPLAERFLQYRLSNGRA